MVIHVFTRVSLAGRFVFITVEFFFLWRYSPNLGLGLPPWNSLFHFGFLDLRQSDDSLSGWSARRKASTCTQTLNIHALSGIGTHDPDFRASEYSAYRDRQVSSLGA
jgi:hypothetical protein